MSKYAQGVFLPSNPDKYIGKGSIKYRSSWEYAFMNLCDKHDAIIQWASEAIRIPYFNPLTNKQSMYVPDFFVVYEDANGKKHSELIEIKPSKEITMESAKSKRDKLMVVVNTAKWAAASQWAERNGIIFRVLSENEIFKQGKN